MSELLFPSPRPQGTATPLAEGASPHTPETIAAHPQGAGEHQGVEKTGSILEGSSREEFFNDG